MPRPTSAQIKLALATFDVILAILAPFVAWLARNFFVGLQAVPAEFLAYAAGAAVTTLIALRLGGVARVDWRFFSYPDARAAFFSLSMGVGAAAVVAFMFDRLDSVPRSLLFLHVFVQFSAYVGVRLLLKRLTSAYASSRRKPSYVLLVGCNQLSYVYARAIESIGNGSLKIAAALTHDPTMVGNRIRGVAIASVFNNIEDVIGRYKIHGVDIRRVVIAANENEISPSTLDRILDVAGRHGLAVTDIHLLFSEVAGPIGLEDDFDVSEITLRDAYWGVKRAIDILGAVILLLLLSPSFVLTAVLVAIDVGVPLVFWQERPGRHGKMIRVFKFRTMKDAVGRNGIPIPDGERTSPIGEFLRKTRLDELPQLWNILRGDMSFIGPRPLLFIDQPEEVSQRLAVRPGVSGWAQVNGGKLVTPEEKRALDLWYIAHASLILDMTIVVRTLLVVFRGDISRPDAVREAVDWLRAREDVVMVDEV